MPLIRQMVNDVPIEQALSYCFIATGLKQDNYPDKLQKPVLIQFIKDNYGGLLAEEIRRAFDMACKAQLKCEINHFQNFSCAYFGQVMNAYVENRAKELMQIHAPSTFVEEKINLRDYYTKKLIEPYEQMLKDGIYPYDLIDGYMFYNRLYKVIDATEDQRKVYRAEAEILTPKKLRKHRSDPEETKEQHENRIVKCAKHLAFKDWIQSKALEQFDLRAFMTPLIKEIEI